MADQSAFTDQHAPGNEEEISIGHFAGGVEGGNEDVPCEVFFFFVGVVFQIYFFSFYFQKHDWMKKKHSTKSNPN